MKPKNDPLKAVFDALQEEIEPVNPDRRAKALRAFQNKLRFLQTAERTEITAVARFAPKRPKGEADTQAANTDIKKRPRQS
jgi:hypothetical protein